MIDLIHLIRAPLRVLRRGLAQAAAAAVFRVPSLEAPFVRTDRMLARNSRIGGGLYWFAQDALIARLKRGPADRYRDVRVGNLTLQVDVSDATGRYPYFYSTLYEKAVTDAVLTALGPGDVFVDIGANIGYFSTLGARLIGPSGRVVAFEPHAGARAALRTMAERNGVGDTIEIVPVALDDRDGEVMLYTTDAFTSYSTLDPARSPMKEVAAFHADEVVRSTTLDGWLAGRADLSSRVRCIKIDVEGAEGRVLSGMAVTLASPELTIVCETTIGSDADVTLERAGYQRHRIERSAAAYGNFLYVRPGRSLAF